VKKEEAESLLKIRIECSFQLNLLEKAVKIGMNCVIAIIFGTHIGSLTQVGKALNATETPISIEASAEKR
jgi:hypothetical protein